jgi:crotonobetainyl-CoA:carnitine CoA-transferase CaiB-like acyl-CoA transferase
MTAPLEGIRVLEYAQYVAGPLCGSLLAELGAEVIKVEPPHGDAYRSVMPVAPGLGRFFVPLNRGKRSVVIDLKTSEGRARSSALAATADVILHNFRPGQETEFELGPDTVRANAPRAVVGVVTSFGPEGPLAGAPAYDLVAQGRAGLLTAHASPGDRVPVRAGGIPMADLTAGHLLATGVLAALVRARTTGIGERVEVSLLAAALAVQVQDLVWLEGEPSRAESAPATRGDLEARAAEIEGELARNPYYRCYAAADGFLVLACLNLAQRQAFAALLGVSDPTIDAPDVVAETEALRARKRGLTASIETRIAAEPVAAWLERLEAAGVPCGPVLARDAVPADVQVRASGLLRDARQPGLGDVRMLGGIFRLGDGRSRRGGAAPLLGEDTEAVLGQLR